MPTRDPTVPQSSPKNIINNHCCEVPKRPPPAFTMPLCFLYRSDIMLSSKCELFFGSLRSIIDRKRCREILIHVSTLAMSDATQNLPESPVDQTCCSAKGHDDDQASKAGESKIRPPGGACNT